MIPKASSPDFATLVGHWPETLPLLWAGGAAWTFFLPVAFTEIPWDEARGATFRPTATAGFAKAVAGSLGLIGVLSYDQFDPSCREPAAPRIFRVEQALARDQATGALRLCQAARRRPAQHVLPRAATSALAAKLAEPQARRAEAKSDPLKLLPEGTEGAYLAAVAAAVEAIRDGRYYQINLLRHFAVAGLPDRLHLARRLDARGDPMAAWIELPDLHVVSFSPERFVRVQRVGGESRIETYPIKGTAPRGAGPAEDASRAAALRASHKDQAELAMIVDLMRNDLARVAVPGTTAVAEAATLRSYASVHHLEARVTARLPEDATLGGLLAAVAPGGSITGAPKRAAMDAIRAFEVVDRRYFMGHVFRLGEAGDFDSSILIRSLVREGLGPYRYAAGSGIVVHSEPMAELREIEAKCRVVVAP